LRSSKSSISATADSLFNDWRERLITLGKPVKVTSVEGVMEGVAESVQKDGSLMLRLSDGTLKPVIAGGRHATDLKEPSRVIATCPYCHSAKAGLS